MEALPNPPNLPGPPTEASRLDRVSPKVGLAVALGSLVLMLWSPFLAVTAIAGELECGDAGTSCADADRIGTAFLIAFGLVVLAIIPNMALAIVGFRHRAHLDRTDPRRSNVSVIAWMNVVAALLALPAVGLIVLELSQPR